MIISILSNLVDELPLYILVLIMIAFANQHCKVRDQVDFARPLAVKYLKSPTPTGVLHVVRHIPCMQRRHHPAICSRAERLDEGCYRNKENTRMGVFLSVLLIQFRYSPLSNVPLETNRIVSRDAFIRRFCFHTGRGHPARLPAGRAGRP